MLALKVIFSSVPILHRKNNNIVVITAKQRLAAKERNLDTHQITGSTSNEDRKEPLTHTPHALIS
jgi:Trk K+ transport system NAD-binding subunit